MTRMVIELLLLEADFGRVRVRSWGHKVNWDTSRELDSACANWACVNVNVNKNGRGLRLGSGEWGN